MIAINSMILSLSSLNVRSTHYFAIKPRASFFDTAPNLVRGDGVVKSGSEMTPSFSWSTEKYATKVNKTPKKTKQNACKQIQ